MSLFMFSGSYGNSLSTAHIQPHHPSHHILLQVIEVQHPSPPNGIHPRLNSPGVHFGVMGAGRPVRNEVLRHDFASRYGIVACDSEFDQVLESIVGNRKDSFMFVRGVSDYVNGSQNRDWTPLWWPPPPQRSS